MSQPSPSFEQRAHRREFGDSVGRVRRERGWTQEQLAERAGVHRSYIAAVESGARNPTLDVIVKLANGLQVEVTTLFEIQRGH